MADLGTLRPEVRGLGPCKMCGASGYSLSYGGPDICPACDCGIDPEVTKLKRELVEMKQSFVLRWEADMRAIKQWRTAHPGSELVMPDHADLCMWLMDELAALKARIADAPVTATGNLHLFEYHAPFIGKRVRLVVEE